jgi:type II secretory ATPase GspE/PulE/Tfp pilus assembly ATPase PilB-like protein
VYEPQATEDCPTGLSGRTAVFELLEINDELERVVLDGADEAEITDAARQNGMLTMKEDALLKAFDGTVPFEEVGKL